jgi:transcriptional regulator with PAS, ATPase and Fis domain
MVIRASIDALHAYVAVLDVQGNIIEVNQRLREYSLLTDVNVDVVGSNYLDVCSDAIAHGVKSAARIESGLRRLLNGEIESFGVVYRCAERTFRVRARSFALPLKGFIVAQEDISAVLRARHERRQSRADLVRARALYATRAALAREELGQRLTGISLAAAAIDQGGDVGHAVQLIKIAVDEGREQLRLLRFSSEDETGH